MNQITLTDDWFGSGHLFQRESNSRSLALWPSLTETWEGFYADQEKELIIETTQKECHEVADGHETEKMDR